MQKKITSQNRLLIQFLILSLAFNMVLLVLFFYFFFSKSLLPTHLPFLSAPKNCAIIPSACPLFSYMRKQPFHELCKKLSSTRSICASYGERDLALALLVERYQLDLNRALGKEQLEERRLIIDDNTSLIIYPGLSDGQYKQILHFLSVEKWPFTSRGLFSRLKEGRADPTLLQAFSQTHEFLILHHLFARTSPPIKRGTLLKMIGEGSWHTLSQYYERQKSGCDFSPLSRRELLCAYMNEGSQSAAYLLLLTDFAYAKTLDEQSLYHMLTLLREKTVEAQKFVKEIVEMDQSPLIVQEASERLSEYTGKEVSALFPEKKLRPLFRDRPKPSPAPQQHIVQPGESLSIIAHKYHISIQELMMRNGLKTTVLPSGKVLYIPPHGGGS